MNDNLIEIDVMGKRTFVPKDRTINQLMEEYQMKNCMAMRNRKKVYLEDLDRPILEEGDRILFFRKLEGGG